MAGLVLLPLFGAASSTLELPGKSWDLLAPQSPNQITARSLPNFEQLNCAECHRVIAEEWASTRHALAWEESVYQEELTKVRKPAKCHACHAPQPVLLTGLSKRPKTRTEDFHFGVDCAACHLGPEGAIHGPYGAATQAHRSVKDEAFSALGSNALCITCHDRSVGPVIGIAKDFDEEDLGDAGYSCVDCHMAKVTRPQANDPMATAPLPARPGRSHALQTPRDPHFLRQAFELKLEERSGVQGLRLANRAGHRIPGLNDRVLEFTVQFLSESGAELKRESLFVTREEPLRIREDRWLPLPDKTHQVRVRGTHEARSVAKALPFLDQSFSPIE